MQVLIVDKVLGVIQEGIKYMTLLLKTSTVRRMRRAVDYGETYILDTEEWEREEDPKKKKQLVAKRKRARELFFRFNQ